MYIGLLVKRTSYACPILIKLEFSGQIFENSEISNFMKICPVGLELLHADRQTDRRTDMTKLILTFRNFVNSHKNELIMLYICPWIKGLSFFKIASVFYLGLPHYECLRGQHNSVSRAIYCPRDTFRAGLVWNFKAFCFLQIFPPNVVLSTSLSSRRAKCIACLILFDLILLMLGYLAEKWNSYSFYLLSFLQPVYFLPLKSKYFL